MLLKFSLRILLALASAAKITLIALFRKLFAIVIMFLPVLALPAVARACSVYWVDGGPALYHVGYIRFTETNLSRISQVSHIKPFQKIIRINQPCHYQPSGSMLRLLFLQFHIQASNRLKCSLDFYTKGQSQKLCYNSLSQFHHRTGTVSNQSLSSPFSGLPHMGQKFAFGSSMSIATSLQYAHPLLRSSRSWRAEIARSMAAIMYGLAAQFSSLLIASLSVIVIPSIHLGAAVGAVL
jgi:hypothetical protein